MDPQKPPFLLLLLPLLLLLFSAAGATGVFRVRHKFASRASRALSDLAAHDSRRHARFLSAADVHLGGSGSPTDTGLFYAELGIGTPSKTYHVQVDTGSDIMWVNCASCRGCPRDTDLKIELTKYDPKGSNSGGMVTCGQGFCSAMYGDTSACATEDPCMFKITYGDGSVTTGYFVSDYLQYDMVSGNHQTTLSNATVTFGCATQVSGDLVSTTEALDGIIGFGQSNSSVISQLASSGKVKKVFSHCLDSTNGGGIFAIGHVMQPKVNTTPLVPNMPHYNVNLRAIEVGGSFLLLPTDLFETGDNKGTIIDSGTTLAYLPDAAYKQLMIALLSSQPNVNIVPNGEFSCFGYSESVDEGFPYVRFHFEGSLSLMVYPHDYLFETKDNFWCIGWQNSGRQSEDGEGRVLLGDLVLSNKLVLYDLENQVIGWTDHNCSLGIGVQDDKTGAVYSVDSHSVSSSTTEMKRSILFLSLAVMMIYFIS